jgi:IS5 family transposase
VQGVARTDRELLDARELVGHLIRPGSMFAFLADHRGELFPDGVFADLFPSSTGRPSIPASVVASVMVLQALTGLSDREAIEALRCDIRWKVACGLALTDEGFDPSTLVYWRRRLAASDAPHRIFDAVKAVIEATGVLKGKHRRALDSTILVDAVATQDTVTQLIAAIRRVGRQVPGAAAIIAAECTGHDYTTPGKPVIDWEDATARDALVSALVNDANLLVDALGTATHSDQAAEAVALLALVAGQDVEPAEGSDGTDGRWRIARKVAEDRVISTVDPDARHTRKSPEARRDGFRAHVAVEPDTGLITDCALTKASGQANSDAAVGIELLAQEVEPVQVLGDSAYGTGEARAALAEAGHAAIIKPKPCKPAVDGGFSLDDFSVDEAVGTVTCPAGVTRPISTRRNVSFGAACRDCPLRARCTTSKTGRALILHPQDALLRQARRDWAADPELHRTYRQHRPMVERTISWLVGVRGRSRRLFHIGVDKNDAWLHTRAAALNLRRMVNLGLTRHADRWVLA